MGKAWTEEEKVLLRENYSPRGKNILLNKLSNRTWCAIKAKARKMGLSFLGEVVPIKNPKLNADMGYILGVVGPGDGYVWLEDSDYKIGLHAKDKDFLDKFSECAERIFGKVTEKKNKSTVYSKKAVEKILGFGNLKDFREGTEKVPRQIKKADDKVKSQYLKGFFDSQGCVDSNSRRVFGVKKYLSVIKEIKLLLRDLGIHSHIAIQDGSTHNPNGKYYRIYISWRTELEKYKRLIGFTIARKQRNLRKALSSYTYKYKRWTNKEEETLRRMYDKNTKEMSILLNRTIGSVQQKAIRMRLTKVVN